MGEVKEAPLLTAEQAQWLIDADLYPVEIGDALQALADGRTACVSAERLAELEAEAKGYRLIRAAALAGDDLPGWLDEALTITGLYDDPGHAFDEFVLGTEAANMLKAARANEAPR